MLNIKSTLENVAVGEVNTTADIDELVRYAKDNGLKGFRAVTKDGRYFNEKYTQVDVDNSLILFEPVAEVVKEEPVIVEEKEVVEEKAEQKQQVNDFARVIQDKINELKETVKNLKAENQVLIGENAKLNEAVKGLELKIKELENTNKNLMDENAKYKSAFESIVL